jgi:hypothetical protein
MVTSAASHLARVSYARISLRPGALQLWYEEGRPKALPEGSNLQAEKRSASLLLISRHRAASGFSQSNP